MTIVNFIIAVIALIVAILAYQRTGGSKDLKIQVSAFRKKTADALAKIEKALRNQEKDGHNRSDESEHE